MISLLRFFSYQQIYLFTQNDIPLADSLGILYYKLAVYYKHKQKTKIYYKNYLIYI